MNGFADAVAVGLGCRRGCAAADIVRAVETALGRVGPERPLGALFTAVDKQGEAGLADAAATLGLPLVYLPRQALAARSDAARTRSERVVALFGVPSVAETAALAGAGPGSVLIVPRLVAGGATCAVAARPRPGETPP